MTNNARRLATETPTTGCDLRPRRLKWLQQIGKHPGESEHFFGKLAGHTNWSGPGLDEDVHNQGGANPWLEHWMQELEKLACTDPSFKLVYLNNRVVLCDDPASHRPNWKLYRSTLSAGEKSGHTSAM